MRRTYRSKKDTAGVLDRKDLLLNLDEKSSAYDAYFIQNIKQTKRELSCIGSSNVHGASNRVRKRKYVKRIVKEAETPCRESMSLSAYLTPDKSIRVNKPIDPFDMLLNSSPACPVEIPESKAESVTSKVDLFDKLAQKKEGRTYTRKKPVKAKKFYYSSSENSDSDKENSDEQTNVTRNTSNIKAYKLLIEHEANITPKRVNDSINNIVNNLSLLKKLKLKNSFNESSKIPLSYNKNRLTWNIQSPILQKSPLCSTPFKVKYRGESIFKFSPISITNEDNSPKNTTITEDNGDSNNSIVFLNKDNSIDPRNSKENTPITGRTLFPNDGNKCDMDTQESNPEIVINHEVKILHKDSSIQEKENSKFVNSNTVPTSIEISSFQTTEAEPFLGFSNNVDEDNSKLKISHLDDSVPQYNVTEIEISENYRNIEQVIQNEDTTDVSNMRDDNNSSLESLNYDKDSMYDTCNSELSSVGERGIVREPIVQIQRMNDSSFWQYYEKMDNFSSEGDEIDENNCSLKDEEEIGDQTDLSLKREETNKHYDSLKGETNNHGSLNDEEEMSDYTHSSQGNEVLSQEEFASFKDCSRNCSNKETSEDGTDIEVNLDNNLFEDVAGDNSVIISNKDISENGSDIEVDLANKLLENRESDIHVIIAKQGVSENGSDIEVDLENNLFENEAGDHSIIISSNDEDGESIEEEKCISFVTTRRRNEVTNNSMMSIFNDSCVSSSTDCDKTVLSNNRLHEKSDVNEVNTEIIDENETLMNINVDDQVISDADKVLELGKNVEHTEIFTATPLVSCQGDGDSRISFVTSRNSTITDRKNSTRNRNSSIKPRRNTISTRKNSNLSRESMRHSPETSRKTCFEKLGIVLQPGKKWERSLSIYRRITMMTDHFDQSILEDEPTETKGRKYRQSVINTMEMQELHGSLHNESINSRRTTFVSKPSRSTIRIIVKDPDVSRLSLCNTTEFDDIKGFLNEECDDTIIELSKLSIADQTHEVTVLDTFHDTSSRIATARDYVLRRCNQTDAILFDECYPDTVLKNCHKIGEGVYGEVFLWRDRDGRARVLKIVPIAGTLKVNGESQKDFHEIISEIVIAMELSALRAPIAEINRHFDEGKDVETLDLHAVENATDIFNEVLAVRCVYGSYPARLLDLWDLYDECKGSENDNPAILPVDQQFIVLELANAGQDLESYQFNNAEQAYALFLQVAYGLAVAEEAFQFEHRDLHWGNVLIAPTEQKYCTFVLGGRAHRVPRRGVAATIIDYSLSRVSLPLAAGECAALYNDLATDDSLFDAVGDYQFEVYRLMRDKLGNDWKNYAPYTNILWLHYTVDKMITALRYKRTNTKIHKHYIEKLKGIKSRILDYGSAALFVLTDNEI